jgi:DNA-directed RNA polymerase specialized sigma24 family protein
MRKVKEVLRLRFELGFGQRQIARSCGMGLSTVHEYLERAVPLENLEMSEQTGIILLS